MTGIFQEQLVCEQSFCIHINVVSYIGIWEPIIFFLGILSCVQKSSFIIHIHYIEYVLNIISILSSRLQSKGGTLGKSAVLIKSVIKTLEDSRSSEKYTNIWENIVKFYEEHNIELKVPVESNTHFYFKWF